MLSLLLLLVLASASASCETALSDLEKFLLPNAAALVSASARGPGSLGNYDDCALVNATRFATAMLRSRSFALTRTIMGLCLPDACGPGDEANVAAYLRNTTRAAPGAAPELTALLFPQRTPLPPGGWAVVGVVVALALLAFAVSLPEWIAAARRASPAAEETELLPGAEKEAVSPSPPRPQRSARAGVTCGSLLSSFSIVRSLESLWSCETAQTFDYFNGLRVFSMAWVMLGHSQAMFAVVSQNEAYYEAAVHRSWPDQITFSFTYSVDAFFYMGGFLAALSVQKALERSAFRYVSFVIHRLLRITPLLLFLLLVRWLIVPYTSYGPLWFANNLAANCDNWWVELLYIQPFWTIAGRAGGQCLSQDWYLATDLHLFLLSPLFVWLIWKWPRAGWTVLATTSAASLVYNVVIQYVTVRQYQPLVYFPFWARFPEYALGVASALLLKSGAAWLARAPLRWAVYFGASALLLVLLFVTYGAPDPHSTRSWFVFNALDHFLWTLALGAIAHVFALGFGGWVKAFLSWSPFRVLARLTFGAYLIHVFVIQYLVFSVQSFTYFSGTTWMEFYAFVVMVSYALSLVTYVLVERPLCDLERQIFK